MQKRGPQAARLDRAARGKPAHFGGYNTEEADRHLVDYHRAFAANSDDDRYFRTTRAIVVAARRWRKVANDRIKGMGQTMARWETLFLVAFSGEGLTQGKLAQLISVEGPTMVRMLDLLAQEGLILRRQSETDGRVTTNEITPRGKEVIGDIMEVTNQLRAEVMRDVPAEKLDVCLEVLSHILGRLDEMK